MSGYNAKAPEIEIEFFAFWELLLILADRQEDIKIMTIIVNKKNLAFIFIDSNSPIRFRTYPKIIK